MNQKTKIILIAFIIAVTGIAGYLLHQVCIKQVQTAYKDMPDLIGRA